MSCRIHAFYKFVPLPDFRAFREPLMACCREHDILGTILLAEEGINGTIAGSEAGLEALWRWMRSEPRFEEIEVKVSEAEEVPFYRMKVRLKKEIVSLGLPDVNPLDQVGTYVPAAEWNALIEDPDVLVVDTRNDYEIEVGSFKGAVSPHTHHFRQFPDYVKRELDPNECRKVAMYCTGGIRCEKATAYMLQQGFAEVYHLHGGILKYLEEIPEEDSLWQGECFVFDNRATVDQALHPGEVEICFGCRRPVSPEDREQSTFEAGVSCPACFDESSDEKKAGARERQRQMELAKERNGVHLGPGGG